MRYEDTLDSLRVAYDGGAERRDTFETPAWKSAEREAFLARLREEGRASLLELGPGAGHDSVFFRDGDFDVVAVDLSPEMVARCRAKGIDARCMDFLHLDLPDASFDAAYSMNSLVHVPSADMPRVLASVRRVLAPGALFFVSVFGGESREQVWQEDWHVPPRFFAYRTDEQWQDAARGFFHIVEFHRIEYEDGPNHGQALTLRRPA